MAARTPSRSSRPAPAYVALLRGINVGGKHIVPMAALKEIFIKAGCADVQTYIQSGNVVFGAAPAAAKRVPGVVAEEIAGRFGFPVPVIVRTGEEMARVVAANPFVRAGADPACLHVLFLADAPEKRRLAGLDPERSPGDFFEARGPEGREIYLHLPNGVARSRLTNAYFDSALATTSTGRNWRTVLKLVEMAGDAG